MQTNIVATPRWSILWAIWIGLSIGCNTVRGSDETTGSWQPPTEKDIPADVVPMVRSLIERTFSQDKTERSNAARELGTLADQAVPAVPFLIRLLQDNEHVGNEPAPARVEACRALERLGKHAVPDLIAALDADDLDTKGSALWVLKDSADLRATDPIIRLLDDADREICRKAAFALREIGDNRAVEPLIELLHNPSDSIVEDAACALGKIKDTRALAPLLELLEDSNHHSSSRSTAVHSVGAIAGHNVIDTLWAILNNPNEDLSVRSAAGCELARLKDPRSFEYLKDFVHSRDDRVRCTAINGLAYLADDQSVKVLIALLETEGWTLEKGWNWDRGHSAAALVGTDKPAAIDAVIAAPDTVVMEYQTSMQRKVVNAVFVEKINVLTLSSNPRAYLWAIGALSHENEEVRSCVLQVLAENKTIAEYPQSGPEDGAMALKDPRIIGPLIAIAKNTKAADRIHEWAVIALRKTEAPEAIEFLESIKVQ